MEQLKATFAKCKAEKRVSSLLFVRGKSSCLFIPFVLCFMFALLLLLKTCKAYLKIKLAIKRKQ